MWGPWHKGRRYQQLVGEWVISKFNGTSTPKGSYSAKTGEKLPYDSESKAISRFTL